MAWSDEDVARLKKLWLDGLSASQIAAELANGVNRNAVIAKVHRLGLSGRVHKSDAEPELDLTYQPQSGKTASLEFKFALHKARPVVPSSKPAAIEPIVRRAKLTLPKRKTDADLAPRSVTAALLALKAQMGDLANELEKDSNVDKRVVQFLHTLAKRIPTQTPRQEILFSLGHDQECLEAYASTAAEEWSSFHASRYLALVRTFDRTMRQFPKWREFKKNVEKDRLNSNQKEEVSRLAVQFAEALKSDDAQTYVDPVVPDTILDVRGRVEPAGQSVVSRTTSFFAEDLLVSLDNVLKTLADIALSATTPIQHVYTELGATIKEAGQAYWKNARKSVVKAAGDSGKSVGPKLLKWAKRILLASIAAGATTTVGGSVGIGAVIANLMRAFPETFSWLRPVLLFLKHLGS